MTSRLSLVLRHPQLKSLYAYWVSRCGDDSLPMAEDVEPADLRPWIGNLVVMDVSRNGSDDAAQYSYAYYSSGFASAFGDKAGRSIDELPEEQRALLKAEYDHVRVDRIPTSRVYTAEFPTGRQSWERLVLPFFDPEGEVVKLLVAAYRLDT
ncbi:MAG: PAS domain-containing protein [Caenispirillum bisanense]|nr:PAS domain-containing protein [Caenispirillum bisanense]MCA1971703.1 PAS domain-containing protein [Caenispirillum sp.]